MLTRIIRNYSRPYSRSVILVFAFTIAQTIGSLVLPSLTADIINKGVATGNTAEVWNIGKQMAVLTVVMGLIAIATTYVAARVSTAFGRDLRGDVFKQVMRFSTQEMDKFGTASLITRNTNDIQQVQMLMTVGLSIMLSAPITLVGGVIMAIRHNSDLSVLIAVAVPLMVIVIALTMRIAIPLFRLVQKRIDRINAVFREQITGTRVVRAFVREEQEAARFAVANEELRTTQLRINHIMAFTMPSLGFILNLATVGVIWFGGHLISDGKMLIGDLTAFISYLMQILISVMMATMTLVMVPRASASAERIAEVLSLDPAIVDSTTGIEVQGDGSVDFRNVTFTYPGAELPVLQNLTFHVPAGTTTAVVGSTGSGKTTLINLIVRFYDVTQGQVLVGGVDVREQKLGSLWGQIGLVPQRSYLFKGSIRDNVKFGAPDATDDDVREALRLAQALKFVEEIDGGLDSIIEQGGSNLSGGQRQRLAIARALASKPSVFVFDDSFSALDATTDARLRHSLNTDAAGVTKIIVAQRVSSIMHADQIIVLDEGIIAGIGTHDDLLKTCDAYKEIVGSQLELAS